MGVQARPRWGARTPHPACLLNSLCAWCLRRATAHSGTDFGDAGDIAVDSFCQHTPPAIARLFGAAGDLRLHTGFYRAWDTVSERVLDAVAKQLKHVRCQPPA